jgi:hypothetical protein
VQTVADKTDEGFGNGEMHVATISSPCCIGYYSSYFQFTKFFKLFLTCRFDEPIRMPHF